ncbi:MBL fold metallo-hydrolase [Nonomuraea sp. MCN248]|uniref:MBL fold metallo-hydrolase n=1 Tax=Nonomuraea corallina TaxID=2989783 RepID=A0ABT4S6M3_9ACTN|nr:alkyl sulfatase dimerization domain-containing protein [Nonomuraea corallina]MDA0632703.1 MBL fold metallo-hydrolase [Nonomuraea corallina]
MAELPYEPDDAGVGFVAPLTSTVVRDADGTVVWDADSYGGDGECPATAHPSLWRETGARGRHGLYEVAEGVYQVRGLDLGHLTLVEGDAGVVVVDPLRSTECAVAGLRLYRRHRGERPVTGVVYTGARADRFGGARGVTPGGVPVLAPAGFLDRAAEEFLYAAPAAARRAAYTYGPALPAGPGGRLGPARSAGTLSLLPPTAAIERTGQEETVDGVRFAFLPLPGAALAFLLPERRALCLPVSVPDDPPDACDPRRWTRCLSRAVTLFAGRADVAFAAHHGTVRGAGEITRLLERHRDLHAYLHDQTVRLMNKGLTAEEIAECLQPPPALAALPGAPGVVRAVYQHYLGWFDGNPARLWEHPPRQSAIRYVECLGGGPAVVALAERYAAEGDLRFAAQLLNHAVFADEGNKRARDLLAEVYTRLGHGSRDAAWRNAYLMGALELSEGIAPSAGGGVAPGALAALSPERLFDALAVRVNGPKAWHERLAIDWHLTDLGRRYRTVLSNGALIRQDDPPDGPVDLTLRLTRAQLAALIEGRGVGEVSRDGDLLALRRLFAALDDPVPGFAIVTP